MPGGGAMPPIIPPSNSTGISSPSWKMQNLWFLRVRKGASTSRAMPKMMTLRRRLLVCSKIYACSQGLSVLYMLRYSSQLQCPSLALLPIFLEKPWKDRAELYCFLKLASDRTEYASLISLNLAYLPGFESGWYVFASLQYDFLISASVESLVTSSTWQQSLEGSNFGTSLQNLQKFFWVRLLEAVRVAALTNFLSIIIISAQVWPLSTSKSRKLQMTFLPSLQKYIAFLRKNGVFLQEQVQWVALEANERVGCATIKIFKQSTGRFRRGSTVCAGSPGISQDCSSLIPPACARQPVQGPPSCGQSSPSACAYCSHRGRARWTALVAVRVRGRS